MRFGVFSDPIWDRTLLFAVVISVIISRWLAYPASIWDMDEANFALGVLHFDPIHNQPHAPFFPLWVALGKIVRWVVPGCEASGSLQLVSAIFSVGVLWPLWSLWSSILPRAQALAASMLYVLLPGPWLLSGRAYSEPTATALLVAGVAMWLPANASRGRLAGGGVAVVCALLVRPQWFLVIIPFVVWRVVRSRGLVERAIIVGVPAIIGAAVVAVVAAQSGGLSPLWAAIAQHRKYMVGASEGFEWGYSDLAIHAASGGIIPGTLWILFTILGGVALLTDPKSRANTSVVVALVAVPCVLLLLGTQNPTLPRYALPILALTAGVVVAGVSNLIRHPGRTIVAITLWSTISIVLTFPSLASYRDHPSPVVAGFNLVESDPTVNVVAVDRRLVAFVTLERAVGRLRQQVVWDYQVELGMVETPLMNDLAALSTDKEPGWIRQPRRVTHLRCEDSLLRLVASPRFLDLTVVKGGALVRPENPTVRPEDLLPGAVVRP